jgi:hypothetical protein
MRCVGNFLAYPLAHRDVPFLYIGRARACRGRALREHRTTDLAVPLLRFHHFQSRIEFMPAGRATDAIRFDRKFV